jgi:hypothetical protein
MQELKNNFCTLAGQQLEGGKKAPSKRLFNPLLQDMGNNAINPVGGELLHTSRKGQCHD